jgi:uncharacterized membrane protein YfcA
MILVHVGFIAGFFGSMLGLGGGWLTVPALQLFGVEPMTAVGTSLTAMIFNAAMGVFRYHKKKILLISLGIVLAVPGVLGVYLGKTTLAELETYGYSDVMLKYSFIFLQLTLALTMFISSRKKSGLKAKKLSPKWSVLGPSVVINGTMRIGLINTAIIGLSAGFLSGLLGIGGGIIMTPALVALFGVTVVQAASASLVSVLMSAMIGSGLYWIEDKAIFNYAAILAISTATGSYLGSSLAPRLYETTLKKIFAVLALLTAAALIFKESIDPSISIGILIVGSTILFFIALKSKKKESPG